ncbi:hypothetical protein ACFXJ5_10695 [Streptomyces sp. NPDC059373]
MPSRRLLGAAALAAALLTLTSCKADGTTAASASASSSPSSAAATASPSVSDLPVDPEPSSDCGTGDVPAGHKVVELVNPPTQFIVQAKAAAFACDPNGGGYAGTGAAKDYQFATDVVAQLDTGATTHRTVSFDTLTAHVRACLQKSAVDSPYSCSGNIYDITLSSSGTITRISEVWHS